MHGNPARGCNGMPLAECFIGFFVRTCGRSAPLLTRISCCVFNWSFYGALPPESLTLVFAFRNCA